MHEPLVMLAVIAVILTASAAQSAIGFGYALISTPLLIWLGIPLPQAMTIVAVCSFVQSCLGASHLNADVPWGSVGLAAAVRLLMLYAGILLLQRIMALGPSRIKLVVGLVLTVLVVTQILLRVKPAPRVHWGWGVLAFSMSGIVSGLCGMGGPPLVLWLLAHDWSTGRMRGFLFGVFVASIPPQIAMMYFTFGRSILLGAALALALAPVVYLGSRVGLPLGSRLGKERLRRIIYGVLLFIGISSVAPPLLQFCRGG